MAGRTGADRRGVTTVFAPYQARCPGRSGLAIGLAFAFSIIGVGCGNADVVTGSYATLDEARAAGAIAPGRMPDQLPSGSRDLREARDLDTQRRWGLFNFPPNQRDQLLSELDPLEISLTGQTCDVPGRIEWWPLLLRGSLDDERIRTTGIRAYKSKSGDLIFAVNWNQGRAYYWTPPGNSR
jgi:hypothetical protein